MLASAVVGDAALVESFVSSFPAVDVTLVAEPIYVVDVVLLVRLSLLVSIVH